jgi:Protein of unknown function (DUF3866)
VLKLRRGTVVSDDPLTVQVGKERRPAWADPGLVGEVREGDEVVVNTEARDLGLGSGGFDVVHANLSRGIESGGTTDAHVMKLNYTSLQHAVQPVERSDDEVERETGTALPVLVIPLHGHLAPAAWAAAQAVPGLRVGYVQTWGGALPGAMSRDAALLRERGLLAGQVSAGPAYGGEMEAISVTGALDAAAALGWQAVIAGPGPGILGSETRYGHGGMAALDSAHAALALGLRALLSPRLSRADQRPRHRGLSHHTRTVLGLLLAEVEVPLPQGEGAEFEEQIPAPHRVTTHAADLDGYAASGLPAEVMGRTLDQDPLFFAAPLAAGTALAVAARG